MSSIDSTAFHALTFDCCGTPIDWETDILNALHPVLAAPGVERDDRTLLAANAGRATKVHAGTHLTRRTVPAESLREFGEDLGFAASEDELASCSVPSR